MADIKTVQLIVNSEQSKRIKKQRVKELNDALCRPPHKSPYLTLLSSPPHLSN